MFSENDFVDILGQHEQKEYVKIIKKKKIRCTENKQSLIKAFDKSNPLYKITKYRKNGKPIIYDKRTMNEYVEYRRCGIDILFDIQVPNEIAFKFKYIFDPYTGERFNDEDPYGALSFHPDYLIRYFYQNRLRDLWFDEVDESDGYFEGHYGDAVGAGDNILIVGRGEFPEKYLFRLPIPECYLPPDHTFKIITMGPKLNDDEIKEIEKLANLNKDGYIKLFKSQRPSLIKMKKLYERAIYKQPNIRPQNIDLSDNYKAIDELRKMKG